MFWGITPCLDLIEEYEKHCSKNPKVLNILLLGSCDARHILQTVAKKYRHEKVEINFYIMEACVENIAKQLLLLNIALQPQTLLGLDQKAKIFMELYGNTLIRPSSAQYLTNSANQLVKMVTDYNYLKAMMSCVTLEIKYKERDYLENLLKFWYGKDDFNICEAWDRRLRKILGVRYDSKFAAFDWDLHMRYKSVGGQQICNQEYRNFRENGTAFTWMESEVSKPNRTMVCGTIPNGESYVHYGYLGDMQTGPFVAFGLSCEDKEYTRTTNNQNLHRSTDVAERNLKQIFYELENQREYKHFKIVDYQLGQSVLKQEKLIIDIKAVELIPKPSTKCFNLEDISINFLSISQLESMKYKEQYKNMFNLIYFANMYVKYIDKDIINNISKENGLVLIENQIFVLSHRKVELEEFGNSISDKLEGLELEKVDFDVQKDCYAKFKLRNSKPNVFL